MLGCFSYKNSLSVANSIYNNKNIAIWDSNANFCYREGCFLAYTGNVHNICKLKNEMKLADLSDENILMTLFLELGENFVVLLDGSFVIVIYDEINKLLHIFCDKNCTKTIYLAKTKTGFIFSDKMTDILNNRDFHIKIDTNCIYNIFALPYAYLGEPFCNLYRICGDEYVTVSVDGAKFFSIEREYNCIKPSALHLFSPQYGDTYINCLLNQGTETLLLPPHIVASAISQNSISNSHLLYMLSCNSYPELMNEKPDFKTFINNHYCNLLSGLPPFEYKTEKDIEDTEEFFINYNLYYKPCLRQIYSLCETYNIKNYSDLLNPSCLKWLFLNQRESLPVFSCSCHLAQDIRKTTSVLCQNYNEPIFKIINRHRLYNSCADAEESFLLFIQRFNSFLKKFKPDLEFF